MKHSMKISARCALIIATTLLSPPALYSQQGEVPADVQIVEQPPEVKAELQAQPSALPTEDVMKPTEHAVQFTPKMARGMAMHMAREMGGQELTEVQRKEFEERLARRVMNVGHQHGKDLVPFFETLFGDMMANQSEKISRGNAPRIGELAGKAAPAIRTFADGLAEDARPYVSPEKYEELLEEEEKMKQAADRVQEEMDKWARGELPEGDMVRNPFEIMEEVVENEGKLKEDGQDTRSETRKQLDQQVKWSYWQKTPQGWRWFLQRVRQTCEFSDEQYEQGTAILRDYEKRAEEIMTPEWKERIQRNRLLFQSQYHLQEQNTREIKTDDGQTYQVPIQAQNIEPWLFQINVEFAGMTAPLDEMKIQYQREIMNLATPEQREAMNEDLRKLGTAHGMEPAMVEAAIQFLFQPPDPKPTEDSTSEGSETESDVRSPEDAEALEQTHTH